MQIETLLPKKKESHNQNKDCLHMTKYLKRHNRKSADANELAEVGPHGNSACQPETQNFSEYFRKQLA